MTSIKTGHRRFHCHKPPLEGIYRWYMHSGGISGGGSGLDVAIEIPKNNLITWIISFIHQNCFISLKKIVVVVIIIAIFIVFVIVIVVINIIIIIIIIIVVVTIVIVMII
jgi:hypothetical protein